MSDTPMKDAKQHWGEAVVECVSDNKDRERLIREHVRSPHGVVHIVQGMTTLCGWHTEGWWTLDPMAMVTCKRCEQNAMSLSHRTI